MGILNLLVSLAPSIISIAQQGQAAWEAYIEHLKANSTADDNASLDAMKSEDVRRQIIAEAEAAA